MCMRLHAASRWSSGERSQREQIILMGRLDVMNNEIRRAMTREVAVTCG